MTVNRAERIQHAIDDLKQAVYFATRHDLTDFFKSVQAAINELNGPSFGTGSNYSYGNDANYGNNGSVQPVSYADLTSMNYNGAGAQQLSSGQQVQAKQIYDYLTQHYHLTPTEAAGILGNMEVESSFNTGAYNGKEGALGLIQWEGDRKAALIDYANSQGKSPYDWQVQVDFMMKELNSSNFSNAYQQLQLAKTPADAAAVFDNLYEISSGSSHDLRMADAASIYALFAPKTQLV